ncbi:MAG TPA: BrnA antitoxin family protein [Terriglobia bacterium]|nr:BrnA antitoxin family protein [Terriglobia bacterium]
MRKASKTIKVSYTPGQPLSAKLKRELAALAALPDREIDLSDIPEIPPGAWKDAVRGKFYRPVKQAVSLRLDADVVAWLKEPGKGYQTRANRILRDRMLAELLNGRA